MRVSPSCLLVTLTATLFLNTSCSTPGRGDFTVRPRIRQSDPTIGTAAPIGRGADVDTVSVGSTTPHGTLVRRVCRTQGWSRDWVATAYENAAGECPLGTGSDSTAFAAIIVRVDAHPVGAVLDICADQAVPRGWEAIQFDEGAEVSRRCPGAGRDGASAIRRIRRMS
jgi:hypothetical protein